MKLRKNAKKYQNFTKERELWKLMQTPIKKKEEEVSTTETDKGKNNERETVRPDL